MADTMVVKAGPAVTRPGEVILAEQDPAHPDGEAFAYAPQPGEEAKSFEVGRTQMVMERLGNRRLVEAGGSATARDDRSDPSANMPAPDTEPKKK